MKTRIFHTKFWTDGYVLSLTPTERLLFNFYITNENIGMTGIYEIALPLIQLSTGLRAEQIKSIQEKLSHDGKIYFYKDWVYIKNAERYQSFTGDKNQIALEKEKSLIPDDTLSILYGMGIDRVSGTPDTPNIHNNKSIIINHKSKKGDVKGDLTEKDFQEIADMYKVPLSFVLSKWDDLQNWCKAKGKTYKDYKAALRNWVKSDAIKISQQERRDKNVREFIDATK